MFLLVILTVHSSVTEKSFIWVNINFTFHRTMTLKPNLLTSFGEPCDWLPCQQATFPESKLFPFLQRKIAVITSSPLEIAFFMYSICFKKKKKDECLFVSSFLLICSKIVYPKEKCKDISTFHVLWKKKLATAEISDPIDS